MEIDLTTPALLFSAISLIMLAYTNRFLSYAQLVRTLKEQYMENPSSVKAAQIANPEEAALPRRVPCRWRASAACCCAWSACSLSISVSICFRPISSVWR
ncbi:DUF2721 domain-containing protein [Bacteroides uniformis]|nr:DUF2721 domain-containing protein [Bacteroides uniformis]